jgi:hypothetical protein
MAPGVAATAAAFTEYPIPIVNAALEGCARGPRLDRALWYVGTNNDQS